MEGIFKEVRNDASVIFSPNQAYRFRISQTDKGKFANRKRLSESFWKLRGTARFMSLIYFSHGTFSVLQTKNNNKG